MKKEFLRALALLLSAAILLPPLQISADETAPPETTDLTDTADPAEPEEAADPAYQYVIEGLGAVKAVTTEAIGTSTTLTRYLCALDDANMQAAFVFSVDPERGGTVLGTNVGEGLAARERISLLKAPEDGDSTLLAAVNADFFSMTTGVPMGVFVENGRFVSSSDGNAAIGFDRFGKAFLGTVDEQVTLLRGETELAVSYVNKYPSIYGVYLLTGDYAATTVMPESLAATEYIIRLPGTLALGKTTSGKITAIRRSQKDGEIPEGCAVLVVPDLYARAADYAALAVGDSVEIRVDCDSPFKEAVNAVGGGDILLKSGALTAGIVDEDHERTRQPRTALGITADGRVLLCVIDGRQAPYSSGVKLTDLAVVMQSLGCTDAINLDGGGSSVVVLFDPGAESGNVVNRPSDIAERKVSNALVVYEDTATAEKQYTLAAATPERLLLTGSRYPLALTLTDADGEAVAFSFDAKNTAVEVDERFGRVEFANGEAYFIAGEADGLGHVRLTVTIGEGINRHRAATDLYFSVASSVDRFTVDQTVILAGAADPAVLHVAAYKGSERLYVEGLLELHFENPDFSAQIRGETIRLTVNRPEPEETTVPEETTAPEETTEPEETTVPEETTAPEETTPEEPETPALPAASGRVAVILRDQVRVVYAFFDDHPEMTFDSILADRMTVTGGNYTLTYDASTGVTGAGAFVLTPTAEPSEIPAETTEGPDETTAETTAEPAETAETTAESAETPEQTETPATPFSVTVDSDALVSAGLNGKRLWLWVDGLSADARPYAVFTVTDADGTAVQRPTLYETYYDFMGYNGRALLTVSPLFETDGTVALTTLLGFTATDPAATVTFGPILLADTYDPNCYTDLAVHWSSYFVNALTYMGVVGGSEDLHGKLVYRPDDGLSREQFAKILVNYLQIDPAAYADVELNFDDVDKIAAWAVPYVRAAVGAGLMKGRGTPRDTVEFAPADGITRQEALYVLGGLIPTDEPETPEAPAEETEPVEETEAVEETETPGDALEIPVETEPAEETEATERAETAGADEPAAASGSLADRFTDGGEVAAWAAENLTRALDAGLISGYDDGSVRPTGQITRAEAATVVVKLYGISSNR